MATYSISSMKNYRGIIETLRGLVVMIVASDATGPGFESRRSYSFFLENSQHLKLKTCCAIRTKIQSN